MVHKEILQGREMEIIHGGVMSNYVIKGIYAKAKSKEGKFYYIGNHEHHFVSNYTSV